jgi:CheY-like chemotaxis protein
MRILSKHGHQVEVVENGREALAALEEKHFDIVLMDVQMPEMDGLAAAASIRAKEGSTGRHLPIIALTAHTMKGDRERCLAAGMDAYVAKPLRPDELFKAMAGLLEAPRNAADEEDQPPSPSQGNQDFDMEAALARVEGDMELFQQMVQLFGPQSGKLLAEIADAVSRGDAPALERAAHKLKGSLGNFAAQGALQTALELEENARAGTCTHLQATCIKLEQQVQSLKRALADFTMEKVPCTS